MTEDLTVVTQTPTDVAQYAAQTLIDTGLDDVARLKPTNLLLVQNTTRDMKGARPGQILDDLTGAAYDEIVAVPLKIMRNRVYFPPGGDLDADPICRSGDGLKPSPFANAPQASSCEHCNKSQWFGKTKPPCGEKLKLLLVVKETGLPRYFTVGGMSIKSLRWMMDNIRQDIEINRRMKPEPKYYNLFDYFFTIKSERVQGGKGTYYIARFESVKKGATIGDFGPLYEQYVKAAKRYADEEEAAEADAAVNVAVGDVVSEVVNAVEV